MSEKIHWRMRAACRKSDAEALFADAAGQNRAKIVCNECVVRVECLVEALDERLDFGVWGGMTERERRALWRRYPDMTSWREVVEYAAGRQDGVG
ncbi:Transcriptional regulator WhiB4 [Streptomyces sp. ADI93-02]|nr:Transcriptional regulator WhiB4 [Streptomyces sp. ADI93-02]